MSYFYEIFDKSIIRPVLSLRYATVYIVVACLVMLFSNIARAETDYSYISRSMNIERIYLYTSFYTRHFSPEDEHVNDQNMFGIEALMTNAWMYGVAMFDNSFGQESEYLYMGYKWNISSDNNYTPSNHYFKMTGGLIHGYEGEYEDKIPFNGLGVAPAVVPTYGYKYKNYLAEFSLGGISVVTVTVGFTF